MERRNFIQKVSTASAGLLLTPSLQIYNQVEYTTEELMGKADIDLWGEGINLRKEAHDAFLEMRKAAAADGFKIKIVSSYRDFYRQREIWEGKYLRYTRENSMKPLKAIEKIIEYSTIPGTSRHHWGTDIDIIDGNPQVSGDVLTAGKFGENGPFGLFKAWLDANSEKFGFYLVYTNEPRRKGFYYEPWHFSYAPLSIPMLKAYRRENIVKLMSNEDFLGCENFTTGFIKNYIQNNILDINQKLL